ncbi:hypothetical protein FHS01_005498 [Longimicrobium terrae]|uniref:Uncharacterized protein n=1 Tax=Longimicrobium terrae TaxID=1639882 RepID=A0A841H6L8_9BACT|nr:hypothetical protein [Longimicrobium terrae]MBB6073737.1 hypothetical protein [Longimicrobium terrae]
MLAEDDTRARRMVYAQGAEFAGGPHPGRHHRPTLPQKRLGEGWGGGGSAHGAEFVA